MRKLLMIAILSGLPLLAQAPPNKKVYITAMDNVLAQIADGAGWSTRIILINMTIPQTAATYTLRFYKDDGTPWSVKLKGSSISSPAWSGTVPANGSVFLETMGTDAVNTQGWAFLEAESWITGMAVFKADVPGVYYAEGVVPLVSEIDFLFYIPLENRNGYDTAVALANPDKTTTATLLVKLFDVDGVEITREVITLEPLKHIAFSTKTRWPLSDGKYGTITFDLVEGDSGISSLGLLFSPNKTFTSVHPVSIDYHYF